MMWIGLGRRALAGVLAVVTLAAPAFGQDTGGGDGSGSVEVDRAAAGDPGRAGLDEQAAAKEARALAALAKVEGLSDARVEVQGDSVRLEGVADDPLVLERAAETAQAATGATQVQNDITLTSDFGERLHGVATRLESRVEQWIAYLPLIPIAFVVAFLGLVIAWVVGRWRWPYRRLSRNPFLQDICRRVVQTAVVLTGVLLALEILNATALVGGVLGAAGVAGIAIGFAFRDLVENYIASILLSVRQPFRPQDHVLIDGHEGLVTSMNSRTTVLTTFDGNIVRIPNATVFKSALTNYSTDPRRRFSFDIGVGYDVDLAEAINVGVEVLRGTEGVLQDPSPFAIVTRLGESSITVSLFGWVDQRQSSFGKVKSAGMQRVKVEYDRRDIDMPEPIYKIKLGGSLPGQTLAEAGADGGGREVRRAGSPAAPAAPGGSVVHDVGRDRVTESIAAASQEGSDAENLLDPESAQE
ncbi:MAG: mechanosensitive ion channel family protein [Phycisphaerales bacterium JB054]